MPLPLTKDSILAKIKAMENLEGEELAAAMAKFIADTMPDAVKAAGALQDPDKIKFALMCAAEVAHRFASQLSALLVMRPNDTHECRLVIPPVNSTPAQVQAMADAIREKEPELADSIQVARISVPGTTKGEVLKDVKPADSPEGQPGFLMPKAKA